MMGDVKLQGSELDPCRGKEPPSSLPQACNLSPNISSNDDKVSYPAINFYPYIPLSKQARLPLQHQASTLTALSNPRFAIPNIHRTCDSPQPDPKAPTATNNTAMAAGLKTIIALSFVIFSHCAQVFCTSADPDSKILAIGFLLVILSCALWHQYLPLLVVATYILAPLPNWICGRCSNPDDFMESTGSAVVDFGRFCTAFLVLMGVGMLPSPLFLCFDALWP